MAASELLDRARAAIPGLTDCQAALVSVDARLKTTRTTVVQADLVGDLTASLLAGEPLPDRIGAQARKIAESVQDRNSEINTLQSVENRLRQHERDLASDGADHGLAFLATELDAILTEAREVFAALGTASTADQAITAGSVAVGAWSRTRPLVDRYSDLRATQTVLVTAAMFAPDSPRSANYASIPARRLVDTFGSVRNYAELFPGEQPWHRDERNTSAAQTRTSGDVESVITTEVRATVVRPWLTGDVLADLRYLAGPEAQPWVPSIRELEAAQTGAKQAERERVLANLDPKGRRRTERAAAARAAVANALPKGA